MCVCSSLSQFLASLSAFVAGTCIGWTSPVLPILRSSNSSQSPLDRPITLIEESWIAALLPLGALVCKID